MGAWGQGRVQEFTLIPSRMQGYALIKCYTYIYIYIKNSIFTRNVKREASSQRGGKKTETK